MPNICHNISLLVFLVVLLSCKQTVESEKNIDFKKLKEPLIEQNKNNIAVEDAQIDGYVRRRNWPVTKTKTGLRYIIYKDVQGPEIIAQQYAIVHYSLSLINGMQCYTTKAKKPERFLVDQDHVESGLHQGIKFMSKGDKARLILPSYLAHGLIGDLNKVPPLSTVIYDIELIDIQKQ